MDDSEIPEPPENLPQRKTWREWWPGHIGLDRAGNVSGCRSKTFTASTWDAASEEMNHFFETHKGLMSVEINPIAGLGVVGFQVLYSKYTSEEEMMAFNRVEAKVRELLELEDVELEKKKALQETLQAKALKEATEKADKEEREKNRLADLGRVHEKNCKKKGK